MIQGILFDFRDTLIKVDNAYTEANIMLYNSLRELGVIRTDGELKELFKRAIEVVKSTHARNVTTHDWTILFMEELLGLLSNDVTIPSQQIKILARIFDEKFAETVELYSEVGGLLKVLQERNMKMGVVIDGTVWREKAIISRVGLEKYLEVVVISEEVGFNKLTKIPLEVALQRLHIPSDRVLVVGDRVDKDIVHANKLGCISVKVERKGGRYSDHNVALSEAKPRYIIRELTEIISILNTL